MQTKIKTTVYAAKLRQRLKELKAKREKEITQYKKDIELWKKQLQLWIKDYSPERIKAITSTEIKDSSRSHFHQRTPFSADKFFFGCPQPPVYPDGKLIQDITNLLRHLGITGQTTVTVSTSDVARFLGDGEKFEED